MCKEPGDITDERAWRERDGEGEPWVSTTISNQAVLMGVGNSNKEPMKNGIEQGKAHDHEYKKPKCRMCDRRMKNPISASALEALRTLKDAEEGACVQLTVDPTTLDLDLLPSCPNPGAAVAPDEVASLVSTPTPNFTFYIHPSIPATASLPSRKSELYFIYYSPDSASVKERMTHTMAVPGLVNVICKDNGIRVQRKLEVHCAEDICFDESGGDEGANEDGGGGGYVLGVKAKSMGKENRGREGESGIEEVEGENRAEREKKEEEKGEEKGKYRSMFLFKNDVRGTESVWSGMEKV